MCLSYIPIGKRRHIVATQPSKFKPRKQRRRRPLTDLSQRQTRGQLTISECFGFDINPNDPSNGSIEPTGDKLIDKDDNTVRFAFQNIHGISLKEGLQVMPEVAVIGSLQIDVSAFTETNIHWSQSNRDKMSHQLYAHLGDSKIVCASNASTKTEDGYQPGGAMLAITGPQTGRMMRRGSDPWGRFAWTEMRGARDEGLLVISAYRVSQKKGTRTGPHTAYAQQLDRMVQEGDLTLDPRSRILKDLSKLITEKRAEGLRPILMMDANDDWQQVNSALAVFIDEMGLTDPLYNKFNGNGLTSTTYARGSRRIDYIFVDQMIAPAIKRIGTLGLHEGINSDHVMLYMDCDEKELFQGRVNRPVQHPGRDFVIEHADKVAKFLELVREEAKKRNFASRTSKLFELLEQYGADEANVDKFHTLDEEIKECILAAAKKVAKKKFGYHRSPELTGPGLELHFWKAVLSCKSRKVRLGDKQIKQAATLDIDLTEVGPMTKRQVRKQVHAARRKLWTAQKNAVKLRVEWLERNAQDIARAAGEVDWEKKMKTMARMAKVREVHRRLTIATKGPHSGLDRIEIPMFEWFYSNSAKELYRYDQGVFEAYAAYSPQPGLIPDNPSRFYTHHHLKKLPSDSVRADVRVADDYIYLESKHPPCQIWQEITNPKQIEKIILQRNKRHLQQVAIEPGRVHDPIMQELTENYGDNDLLDSIRNGTLSIDEATDEAIQAWLSALQQTGADMKLPPLTGLITREEFQAAFKAVKERTSSSPSGLHYSIWKALASDDDLSEWLSMLMSMPFVFGFAHNRWATMIDVMLEKKKGVRQIHQLRIIGILEADFNTALKIIFGHKLMKMAEQTGLDDEQWGSRKNRTCTDAAIRKMMTFEYGRYMNATIGLYCNDQSNNFDRMPPKVTASVATVHGCTKKVTKGKLLTMKKLKRHIKYALGVSNDFYQESPDDPEVGGEVQGKGDVPSLWCMVSSSLLRAHRALYDGITLPSVVGKTGIRKNNDGYVDDVDTWAGSLEVDPDIAKWVIKHLEHGAQKWADLQDVVGQSTAFHKCFVQILAHNLVRDSYEIDYETVHSMVLHDSKGAGTKIKFIPANEPNPGLGFHICPDGNQDHEFNARKEKTSHICKAAQSIFLDQLTTRTLLYSRLVPQAAYVMRLSQFTEQQCHQLDVMVNRTFLPLMKVNRNTPRAVVHGPIQYGGMNLPKHSALQDQWNLHYFVQSLRWDDIVANDIITVLDAYQLRTGFVTNVLTAPEITIDYMPRGLIHHIRNRLRALSGELYVEKAWSPQLQRKDDDSIMERVAACTTLSRKEKRLTNELRIHKGIICISDIASPDGTCIPWERMQKFHDWRTLPLPPSSDNRIRWPNVPPPSEAHYAAFRKAIRHTFCTRMSPYQRSRYILDTPLGPWKLCTKHSLHSSYIDVDSSIYVCDEGGTFKCTQTSTAKTYEINYGTQVTLPPTAIPTQATMLQGNRLRVDTRQYLLYTSPQAPSQNAIFDDTFEEREDENITIVSDCAVEVANGRAAGAWHIYHDKEARRRVARTIEHLTHAHSYRDEMTIMYHALADAEATLRHPHTIIQMMDNEAGLNTLDTPITYPSQTMGTDMDVTLAYQKLRSESKHTVEVKWVMGHADRKKRKNPQDITPSEYTNIDCDEEAGLRLSDEATPATFHPLPGYRAMLRLGQDWVTTQLRECVQFSNTAPDMAEYIRHRLEITEETFQTIDWAIIGHVRASHKFSQQIRTSKMMFRWMPVGHNWTKCNLQSDRCPCCGAPDETFDHVLSCEGGQMAKARSICYTSFLAGCKEKNIPTILANTILESLKMVTENKQRPSPHHIPSVEKALLAQDKIGYSNMSVGFYATEWRHVAEDMGVEQPQTTMERILSLMWDTINEQMWAERNSIKHSKESHTLVHEKTQQIDQLIWYVRHQNEVLDYRHRYLADFTIEDARRWSRHTRTTKLQHLHNAREYYEIETRQKSINQSTIFDWLNSYTTLRSGTVIGPGIRRSSTRPHSVSSDDASTSTEEAEFEWESRH